MENIKDKDFVELATWKKNVINEQKNYSLLARLHENLQILV